MFEGLSVAIVTPMKNGAVDLDAMDRVIDRLLEGGVQGFLPAGTTGEGATLSLEERKRVISRVVARAAGRAWVVPGTGSNDTATTIELTKMARDLGASGALVVTPYYNKPTQDGLRAHFEAVAEAVDLPLMLYNVPSRTSVNMLPETVKQLAPVTNIVAIKEAAGSLDQATELCREVSITVLSGDDSLTLPMLAVGAKGVVSVLGHIAPAAIQSMLRAFAAGRTGDAMAIHQALYPLTKTLFLETNPAPVKHALARLGLIEDEVRLPLVPMSATNAAKVDEAMAKLAAMPGMEITGVQAGARGR